MSFIDSDLHISANTGFVIWSIEVPGVSISGYIAYMLQIYIEKRFGTVPTSISGLDLRILPSEISYD
jgi:hypothetical protein